MCRAASGRGPDQRPRDALSRGGDGFIDDHVPVVRIVDRAARDDHPVAGRPAAEPVVSRLLPAHGDRATRRVARGNEVLRRARRAPVDAVLRGVALVVVEGPPLVVGAAARRDARLPEEGPALAGKRRDIQLAVAVGIAHRGRRLDPPARELRPAGRLTPGGAVGVKLVHAGAHERLALRSAPRHACYRGLREELEVVGGARIARAERCRSPDPRPAPHGSRGGSGSRRAGWPRRSGSTRP